MTKSIQPKNLVLYADDDPDDRELVEEAFARYAKDVKVVTFRDGGELLSYVESLSNDDITPCLIILDINMPGVNGKEALVRLRQMNHQMNNVPVVMFTTSNQGIDKTFAEKNNAGFITKPLEMTQMEMITDKFISHCNQDIQKMIRRQMQ